MQRFITLTFLFLATFSLNGCLKLREPETAPIGQQTVQRVFPQRGNIVDAKHGKELWFAIGPVAGIGHTMANGVANSHYFEDGSSLVAIQLNIAVPEDGSFYEAWLIPQNGVAGLRMGQLTNTFNDVRHQLRFETKADVRNSLKIVVRLQKIGTEQGSGPVVAEGNLVERKR